MADRGELAPVDASEGVPLALVVAIVNYCSANLVIDGLRELVGQLHTFREGHVIIVDNASPDGDADRLADFLGTFADRDRVSLVRSPVNGGFAAGNNRAFAAARALPWRPDAVMLLNPDAKVTPGALEALARVLMTNPRAGVVGAQLLDPDGTPSGSAFRFPSMMNEFARMVGNGLLLRIWPNLAKSDEAPFRADWVTGAAMMIRYDILDSLGGMDEGYFLYYEEVDFMLQASRIGWDILHEPRAAVIHDAGMSTGIVRGMSAGRRMPAYWFQSWLRYFVKNHGIVYARVAATVRLLGMGLGMVQRRLRGKPYTVPPYYVIDFVRHCLFGDARRHKEELRRS